METDWLQECKQAGGQRIKLFPGLFLCVFPHLSIKRSIPARWTNEQNLGKGSFRGNHITFKKALSLLYPFHPSLRWWFPHWAAEKDFLLSGNKELQGGNLMHRKGAAKMTAVTSYSCEWSVFMLSRARWERGKCVTERSLSSCNNKLVTFKLIKKIHTSC